ncbi:MAG: Rieske (2Fe-2S) protein [Kineosporiaceae bacterium]
MNTPTTVEATATDGTALGRRRVIQLGAAGVCGLITLGTLTACGSDDDKPADAASPSASGGGEVVAKLSEVAVGATVVVTGGTEPLVLYRESETVVKGFSAKCTHKFATVALAGDVLDCPLHHSKFDPKTGARLDGVAVDPLPKRDVSIKGEDIVLA